MIWNPSLSFYSSWEAHSLLSLSLLQANGEAVQFLSRRSRTPRHDTKGLGGGNRGNRGNSGIQSRHRMTYRE